MVENEIKESLDLNLSNLWNYGEWLSRNTLNANIGNYFLDEFNNYFLSVIKYTKLDYLKLLKCQIDIIKQRSQIEKNFWENERSVIQAYSKEEAINALLRVTKIDEKISRIEQFVNGLSYD
jgi:hypothetical protein